MNFDYDILLCRKSEDFLPRLGSYLLETGPFRLSRDIDLLALSSGGISSTLTVLCPPAVAYLAQHIVFEDVNKINSIIHGLRGSGGLLIVLSQCPFDTRIATIPNIDRLLYIQLPSLIHSPSSGLVFDLMNLMIKPRKQPIANQNVQRMIGETNALRIIKKITLATLANPGLCGNFFLSDNGVADLKQLIETLAAELSNNLVARKIAEVRTLNSAVKCGGRPEGDPTSFQENFGVILPDWQQGLSETIASFLVQKKLL